MTSCDTLRVRRSAAPERGELPAMSFGDILPIILVVIFWAFLFAFAFWMARVALRAPTEGEIEAQHDASEHAQATVAH